MKTVYERCRELVDDRLPYARKNQESVYVGLDPGGLTGAVVVEYEDTRHIKVAQLFKEAEEISVFYEWLKDVNRDYNVLYIVAEQFILGSLSTMREARYNLRFEGMLFAFAWLLNLPVVFANPANRTSYEKLAKLRGKSQIINLLPGRLSEDRIHALDAYSHVLASIRVQPTKEEVSEMLIVS